MLRPRSFDRFVEKKRQSMEDARQLRELITQLYDDRRGEMSEAELNAFANVYAFVSSDIDQLNALVARKVNQLQSYVDYLERYAQSKVRSLHRSCQHDRADYGVRELELRREVDDAYAEVQRYRDALAALAPEALEAEEEGEQSEGNPFLADEPMNLFAAYENAALIALDAPDATERYAWLSLATKDEASRFFTSGPAFLLEDSPWDTDETREARADEAIVFMTWICGNGARKAPGAVVTAYEQWQTAKTEASKG